MISNAYWVPWGSEEGGVHVKVPVFCIFDPIVITVANAVDSPSLKTSVTVSDVPVEGAQVISKGVPAESGPIVVLNEKGF